MPRSELQYIFLEEKALSGPETCLASLSFAFEKQR